MNFRDDGYENNNILFKEVSNTVLVEPLILFLSALNIALEMVSLCPKL